MKTATLIFAALLAVTGSFAAAQTAPLPTTPAPTTTAPQAPPRETVTGELAQERSAIVIPALATPNSVSTPAGTTAVLGRQIAEVIAADLERSGLSARDRHGRSHRAAIRRLAHIGRRGAGAWLCQRRCCGQPYRRLLPL
jgi:hypothetical protein